MKITNVDDGPRGLNTKTGLVVLEAGETHDGIEMEDAEIASAARTGWFEGLPKAAEKAADNQGGSSKVETDKAAADKVAADKAASK